MPARLRDIARICATLGIRIEKPNSGSHWKAKREGEGTYPIPAANGERTEISDKYIRGLCRHFNISYDEMMRLLRE
ncbi:MAG: hypothetical protein ACRENK_14735 [Gemmatimonadaceae bacterium]